MNSKRIIVALALCTAVGCTTNGSAPSGFGVNLTIDGSALTAAQLHAISSLLVTVTGEKAPYSKTLPGTAITSGTVHVQYVPGITTGSLVFEVNADNGSGSVIASGVTGQIALATGKATTATVKLAAGHQADMGVIALGTACAHDSDCSSSGDPGHCADGVCCDTSCTGTCESCNLTASQGTCTAIPANTDPQNECGAVIPPEPTPPPAQPDMAGADLLGVDLGPPPDFAGVDLAPPYNYPDGGVKIVNGNCAGSCSGTRSCTYPDATKTCGTAFCNSSSQIETPKCDGAGGCNNLTPTTCSDFICGAGACKTVCVTDADCLSTDFCDPNTHTCKIKVDQGGNCSAPDQCSTGYCVGTVGNAVCCNSKCAAPSTCNDAARPGFCECASLPSCTAGCVAVYADADGDGFGDPSTNGGKGNPACADAIPAGFVAPTADGLGNPQFDCDDGNVNAFPGQTHYFTKPRSTGSYDYNCDGQQTPLAPTLGDTCLFGSCFGAVSACGTAGQASALSQRCRGSSSRCPEICFAGPTSGFVVQSGVCGSSTDGSPFPTNNSQSGSGSATYRYCGTCSVAGGVAYTSTYTGPQPCN